MIGFKRKMIQIIKVATVPIILEIACRIFRIPFFPIWSLLFFNAEFSIHKLLSESSEISRINENIQTSQITRFLILLKSLILNGTLNNVFVGLLIIFTIEIFIFGSAGIDFCLSIFFAFAILVNQQKKVFWQFTIIATMIWSIIGLFTNRFPIGAMDIEVIFSSVLVRIVRFEFLSGLLSRFILMSLVYSSVKISKFIEKKVKQQFSIFALIVFFLIGCDNSTKEVFIPEKNSDKEIYFIQAKNPESFGVHQQFTKKQISNTLCLSCHSKKINDHKKTAKEFNIHFIHFAKEKIKIDCTFCHENIDVENSNFEFPGQNRRRLYNQKCVSCHLGTKGGKLNWEKKYL